MSESREIFDDIPPEVDFSASLPNHYVGKVHRRTTINIDDNTIDYSSDEFKCTSDDLIAHHKMEDRTPLIANKENCS